MSIDSYDPKSPQNRLPVTQESERLIAEQSQNALRVLKEKNALDLIDVLGLAPYYKSA